MSRERRFVKSLPLADADMLGAEADGLRALAASGAIAVPHVIELGARGGTAFLATSWLDFGDQPRGEALGRALARVHRAAQGSRYGWSRDNYIGRTPQLNGWDHDWAAFFRDKRLRPQLERAARYRIADASALLDAVPQLLRDHNPSPSLLHGDRGYESAWPLPRGHETRRDLYNLYHVVNHLNLFGASYLAQAETTIARLLGSARMGLSLRS